MKLHDMCSVFSAAAIQIGFQSADYVGMESLGNLTVCTIISTNVFLDREVLLEMRTINGSADGNNVAFTSVLDLRVSYTVLRLYRTRLYSSGSDSDIYLRIIYQ